MQRRNSIKIFTITVIFIGSIFLVAVLIRSNDQVKVGNNNGGLQTNSEESYLVKYGVKNLPEGVNSKDWQEFNNGEISFQYPPLFYIEEYKDGMKNEWNGYWYIREIYEIKDETTGEIGWGDDRTSHATLHRYDGPIDRLFTEQREMYKNVRNIEEQKIECGKKISFDIDTEYYPRDNSQSKIIVRRVTLYGSDLYSYLFYAWEDDIPQAYPEQITDTIKFVGCS